MALTTTERAALELVLIRIDRDHPLHNSKVLPPETQAYVDTWILPALEYALGIDRRTGDDGMIRRDHATYIRQPVGVITGQRQQQRNPG